MKKTRSIISWFGGKWYHLDKILPFPEHKIYIEPFCGSCVILLNKIESVTEVCNDINSRLINFWNIIKERYYELKFLCKLKGDIDSRELFEKYKDKSEDSLEDAFRFFYVNHHSFSAMGDTYGGFSSRKKHLVYLNQIKRIKEIYNRIKSVKFENQDFQNLFKRIDRKDTLIYLDPPYFSGGKKYEKGIGGVEWKHSYYDILRKKLNKLENAKFVMSIDNKDFFDNPNWFVEEIERYNYAGNVKVSRSKSKSKEYIIRNFDNERVKKMQKPTNQKSML